MREFNKIEQSGNGGEASDRDEAKTAVAEFIQEYLDQEGHKVNWLAEQIGVHRTTISRILHGKVLPDPATCRALARIMKLPDEQILALAGYISTPLLSGELDDPELGFYLSQIGSMPEATRDAVKAILREEFHKQKERGSNQPVERPSFARKHNRQ